jgi:hypothetical protein
MTTKEDKKTLDEKLEGVVKEVVDLYAKVDLPDQSVTRQSTDYHNGFEDACLQWDLIMTSLPRKVAQHLRPLVESEKEQAVRGFVEKIIFRR